MRDTRALELANKWARLHAEWKSDIRIYGWQFFTFSIMTSMATCPTIYLGQYILAGLSSALSVASIWMLFDVLGEERRMPFYLARRDEALQMHYELNAQ